MEFESTNSIHSIKMKKAVKCHKILLERVLNKLNNLNTLAKYITEEISVNKIDIRFYKMMIFINKKEVISDMELNARLVNAYNKFLTEMYNNNIITEQEMNDCISCSNLLFEVVSNYDENIVITV